MRRSSLSLTPSLLLSRRRPPAATHLGSSGRHHWLIRGVLPFSVEPRPAESYPKGEASIVGALGLCPWLGGEEVVMSRKTMLRWLTLLALGLASASLPLAAQDTTSVAEAAKRARQQKQESTKPAKVITNDEIPGAPAPSATPAPAATPGTAASTPEGPTPAGTTAPADAKKSAEEAAADEAAKKAEIEELKKKIHDLEHDINIQRGAVRLDENTYYSDPNRPRNTSQKDKIDREKQDLERMESDLADALAKLAELGVPIETKPPKPPESITSNAPPQS